MENRAYALAAGSFTLLLAAALVAAGLWFRRDDVRFAQYLVTTTSSVSGSPAISGTATTRSSKASHAWG